MSADLATATTDGRITDSEESPCPWCAAPVTRIEQGGNLREFCSRKHKTLFNTALTAASIEHSRLLRIPGALKLWTEQRVHPSASAAGDLSRAPEGAEQQDSPSAATNANTGISP